MADMGHLMIGRRIVWVTLTLASIKHADGVGKEHILCKFFSPNPHVKIAMYLGLYSMTMHMFGKFLILFDYKNRIATIKK